MTKDLVMGLVYERLYVVSAQDLNISRMFRSAKRVAKGLPFMMTVVPGEVLDRQIYNVRIKVFSDGVSYIVGVIRDSHLFPLDELNRMMYYNLN